jgi:hypothetical protein
VKRIDSIFLNGMHSARGAWTKPAVDVEGDAPINAGGKTGFGKCGGKD